LRLVDYRMHEQTGYSQLMPLTQRSEFMGREGAPGELVRASGFPFPL
jgi:hypothetical protein